MTRTAKSPRLSQHSAEPFLEIHPGDAAKIGLLPASIAEITSQHGRALLRVQVTDRVRPGDVFAPMHWSADTAPCGRVDALVAPNTDPISGQPESKASVVQIRPFAAAWYGFAISTSGITPQSAYWARARTNAGWRCELAAETVPQDWEAEARALFGLSRTVECISLVDPSRGSARLAFMRDDRLLAALYAGPAPVAVSRSFLCSAIGQETGSVILSGRPGADRPDPGATVCACFDVGLNTIVTAIRTQGLTNVEAIGAALQAGSNCGSCKPELQALLDHAAPRLAAE